MVPVSQKARYWLTGSVRMASRTMKNPHWLI